MRSGFPLEKGMSILSDIPPLSPPSNYDFVYLSRATVPSLNFQAQNPSKQVKNHINWSKSVVILNLKLEKFNPNSVSYPKF